MINSIYLLKKHSTLIMKKYSEILLNTFFENTMQNEFLLMPTALFTIKEFSAFFNY